MKIVVKNAGMATSAINTRPTNSLTYIAEYRLIPARGSPKLIGSAWRNVFIEPLPDHLSSRGVKGCNAPFKLERLLRAPLDINVTRPYSSLKTSRIRLDSLYGRRCNTKHRCNPSLNNLPFLQIQKERVHSLLYLYSIQLS